MPKEVRSHYHFHVTKKENPFSKCLHLLIFGNNAKGGLCGIGGGGGGEYGWEGESVRPKEAPLVVFLHGQYIKHQACKQERETTAHQHAQAHTHKSTHTHTHIMRLVKRERERTRAPGRATLKAFPKSPILFGPYSRQEPR